MADLDKTLRELVRLIKKSNARQQDALAGLIRFAMVNMMTDGNTQHCQVKTSGGELLNNVAFLEPYGFTAKPLPKSETLLLRVGGSKFNNVVLNIGNRSLRFKELKNGEVAMYDNSGNLLHFKNGGEIDFKAAASLNQTAPAININGAKSVNVETQTAKIKAKNTTIDSKTATIKVETAKIDASETITTGITKLANGTLGAAFIGCSVEVDPNTHKGTITSGSAEVLIK